MSENNNIKKKQDEESIINQAANEEYRYGFVSDFETDVIPKGLNEDVVRRISSLKNEPEWLLDRLHLIKQKLFHLTFYNTAIEDVYIKLM